mgnify:CR=1 FL=1
MVADKPGAFPDDHYCIKGDQFRDNFDDDHATAHCAVRYKDKIVASCRIVDGKHTPLEMEIEKWFDLKNDKNFNHLVTDPKHIAEPSRVIADRSIRGSNLVPLMYLHCLDWFMENEIYDFVGMVNSEAKPLMNHYAKWANVNWITDKPFNVDSFVKGRTAECCIINIGKEGTDARDKFLSSNYLPAYMGYKFLGMKKPLPA